MPVQVIEAEDSRQKYKTLKRKLEFLIYENERYKEEIRLANKCLLRVRRDTSFLLDQLAEQQGCLLSSSDSDLTDVSDTEQPKRRKVEPSEQAGKSGGAPRARQPAKRLSHVKEIKEEAEVEETPDDE